MTSPRRLRRLLAVTHEATITGAPMNLLHFLRWVTEHTDVEVHTLIVRDGPLRDRFERVGDVTVLDESMPARLLGLTQRGLVQLGSRRAWRRVAAARLLPQLRHLTGYDVLYLNSLASTSVLEYVPEPATVVSHVHELQVAMRAWTPSSDRDLFLRRPDVYIASSRAVSDMLLGEFGVDPDRVLLHHEFIDTAPMRDRRPDLRRSMELRRAIGIPLAASVVMGAGTVDWRKGPDLFVQLAAEVARTTRDPVHFVWVGGDLTGIDMERLRSDMERAGTPQVHFVGTKPQPLDWFDLADVFALTSREDPYPLVCLEHAALGHPIVTYRNGGMVELLDAAGPEAAQGIVAHLDVGSLARAVIDLLDDEALAARVGAALRERVVADHDVQVAAPRLFEDLERLFREP